MIDLYLRADTEQGLIDALPFARALDDNGVSIWRSGSHTYSLDVIGDLYNSDAVYDEEGNIITPATKMAGFHANLRCTQEIADLVPESVIITPPPGNLKRVWA